MPLSVGSEDDRTRLRRRKKYGIRFAPYRGLERVGMWVKLKYAAINLKKLAI
ncbi:MAG: hypothetical protein HFE61_09590 [Anaerotignum sp.]|nr:hypothetical protein [Anaerotignum sp.]